MTMSSGPQIISGTAIAEKVLNELQAEITALKAAGRTPGLAVVLVGDNPASRSYVRAKDRMCQKIGLHSVKLELPADHDAGGVARRGAPSERRPRHPRHSRPVAAAQTHRRTGGHPRHRPRQGRGRFPPGQRRASWPSATRAGSCLVRRWVASGCWSRRASKRPGRTSSCSGEACWSESRSRC